MSGLEGGVCSQGGYGLGECLLWGVSAPGGVCSGGGCLLLGGSVCLIPVGVWYPSMH